jgi:hypothetical protein
VPAAAHHVRQSRVLRASVRFSGIAVAATACAYASAWVAFVAHHWSLPPTDGAYGLTVAEMWADPAVQSGFLVFFAFGGALGSAFAGWLLWTTRLSRSIPTVFTVTVATAFLTGTMMPATLLLTLAAGVAAMVWSRRRFPAADSAR